MTTTLSPRHMKRRPGMAATLRPALTSRTTMVVGGVAVTVASVGGVALAGPAMAAPTQTDVVVLQYGSSGSLVKVAQQRLGGLAVDGQFGPATQQGVTSFQARKGLATDGVVGPLTWAALGGFPGTSAGPTPPPPPPPPTCSVKVLRYGASGPLVSVLQQRVGVSSDGQFGPVTLGAVKSYQASNGITADGSGVVGAATWRALGGMPCNVAPTPPAPPAGGSGPSTPTTAKLAEVVRVAQQYLGVPYVWGGTTPSGFDCSGLTQYVYAKVGLTLPRTSQAQQAYATPTTSPVPGDLIFFGYPAYHEGIYIGDGKMIAAPRPGLQVRIQDYYNPTGFGTLR